MISNGTIIRLFTINYGIIVFRAPPEFGILVTYLNFSYRVVTF